MATKHRSQAYFYILSGPLGTISKQARFVLRMMVACHAAGVAYSVAWERLEGRMLAKLEAEGDLPMPKPFPKAPPEPNKALPSWKPNLFSDASYRTSAYYDAKKSAWASGFVVEHSCGLNLVRAGTSETGELAADEGEDVRENWMIIHAASGKGFGIRAKFNRAAKALLHVAEWVDWKLSEKDLKEQPNLQRAGLTVQALYAGSKREREVAARQLAVMDNQ